MNTALPTPLHVLDRLPDDDIYMTQCSLSELLGVRREGITEAARHLQSAGCIEYRRGHIHVSDRSALERLACECYAAVSREYTRLLAPPRRGAIGVSQTTKYGGVGDLGKSDWRLNVRTYRRIQKELELTPRC
jgi:hypothetical protein